MRVKFWGAAQTVTGSMHLIELKNGKKILLECGLYQGSGGFKDEYNRSFPCNPSEIDFLILSHAHIDHCGNIPQLVREGFRGNIYCTHATYDLATIMLQDSARIQESDARHVNKRRRKQGKPLMEPYYTTKDVQPALKLFHALPYGKWTRLAPDVELMFLDAGHMLGSASVSLRIQEQGQTTRLGFTGDIGRYDQMILRDPQPMPQCDYLISESTYGGKVHEDMGDTKELLFQILNETCVKRGGKLIVPAFSVGRTQNLVHSLDQLETEGRLPKIPVYVDSPLAVNATTVFETHPECYDEDLMEYLHTDKNPFGFNSLTYVRDTQVSKDLNDKPGPYVVISSSGMMTAGRILHHLAHGLEDERNTVLVVGYCAGGTLGSKIVNGEKEVRIHGQNLKVKAEVKRLNGFSGHGGQDELLAFIRAGQDAKQLRKIFLVHGEGDRSQRFKQYLNANGYGQVEVPKRGDVFEL